MPVDGFVASAWSSDGGNGTAPASLNLTRVTTDAFNSISTDGQTVTQQNFIDGYYRYATLLSTLSLVYNLGNC